MFHNWLKPKSSKLQGLIESLASHQLGRNIQFFGKKASLQGINIAIVGFEEKADLVREHLFPLSFPFKELSIMDMGNLRNAEIEFAIPLIRELLAGKILPLIIGNYNAQATSVYHAFRSTRPLISLASIANRLYFDNESNEDDFFFNDILLAKGYESQLFHFASIGSQTHYTAPHQFEYLNAQNFDYIGLGNARQNIKEVEPLIRDADIVNMHLNALKQSEAPGAQESSPGGFSHEEACQLMRYAGMSDKLKAIGVYGMQPENDINDLTAKVAAQLIWYFLDGFFHRKMDFPVSEEGLVEYVVDAKNLNGQMIFYRSNKSGRWWMRVPIKVKENYYRHGLIACSYTDYQMACMDELPDRLIRALQRFS